jgi:hypothetical protein
MLAALLVSTAVVAVAKEATLSVIAVFRSTPLKDIVEALNAPTTKLAAPVGCMVTLVSGSLVLIE